MDLVKEKPTFQQIAQTIQPIFASSGVIAGLLLDQGLPDLTVIEDMTKEDLLASVVADLSNTVLSLKENLNELVIPQTPKRFAPTIIKLSSPETEEPLPNSLDQFKTACECASNLNLFNKEAKKLRLLLKKMTGEKLESLTQAQRYFLKLSDHLIDQSDKNLVALYALAEEIQSNWSFRSAQALMSPDYWPSFKPETAGSVCLLEIAFSSMPLP
jgi:hypothetical protein